MSFNCFEKIIHFNISLFSFCLLLFHSGVDRSGECNMTYHEFVIDDTPPKLGKMKTGPYFDMVWLTYYHVYFSFHHQHIFFYHFRDMM